MRDFFKIAAASMVGTIAGLFSLLLLMGLGAFGLVGVLLSSSSSEPEIALDEKSVLVFDLGTDIIDGVPGDAGALFEVYGKERSISLHRTLEAIAAAGRR